MANDFHILATLGRAALIIAFSASGYALATAGLGQLKSNPVWIDSGRRAAQVTFILVSLAAALLWTGLLTDDFALQYVAQVSSREQPVYLKITALWGGQAGSLLFWNLLLAGFAAVAMRQRREDVPDLFAWVIVVVSLTQIFFLGLSAFIENPFAVQAIAPADGRGLNPLLRHPGMIAHPPMLYLGFIGFTIPYAYAMAGLISGRLDEAWNRETRRWTLAAWLFLSLGLLLGGRWAYDVLGWGGYWAWDPVENASFMPWLAGTAYLHSVIIQEKRGMFKIWNIFLVVLTFLLVILGTFIVRSGVISSVHAFAESNVGIFYFGFAAFMLIFSTYWITRRWEELTTRNHLRSLFSREAAFLINNFLFLAILAIVFVFTYLPIISELIVGEKIGVGPPVYEQALGPLFAALLLLMGVAPLMMWGRASLRRLGLNLRWPLLGVLAGVAALVASGVRQGAALAGFAILFFSLLVTLLEFGKGVTARRRRNTRSATARESYAVAFGRLISRQRRRYGGYAVHLGVVLIGFGVIGSSMFQESRQIRLDAFEEVTVGSYRMVFREARSIVKGKDLRVIESEVDVYRGEQFVTRLTPHINVYDRIEQSMTIPDARSTLWEDFYVLLIYWEPTSATAATFRIYINPLINLIWIGALVFVVGTLIAAWPERKNVRWKISVPIPAAATRGD